MSYIIFFLGHWKATALPRTTCFLMEVTTVFLFSKAKGSFYFPCVSTSSALSPSLLSSSPSSFVVSADAAGQDRTKVRISEAICTSKTKHKKINLCCYVFVFSNVLMRIHKIQIQTSTWAKRKKHKRIKHDHKYEYTNTNKNENKNMNTNINTSTNMNKNTNTHKQAQKHK